MDLNLEPRFLNAWQDGWARPERLSLTDWAQAYVSLPANASIPGPFSAANSRYMLEIFEAIQNPRVRQVIICASVQTGKSLIAQLALAYWICNAPGDILYLLQNEAMAAKVCETRLNPLLFSIEPLRALLPDNRHERKKTHILFPNSTSLMVDSAKESSLQTRSIRYAVGDECYLYKPGHVQQLINRTVAFPNTSKVILVSVASEEGEDFDVKWHEGHQAEWAWTCPKCGHAQPYYLSKPREDGTYAGLNWVTDETTRPNGRYNFPALAKTLKLSCFKCRHEITDTPENRKGLNDSGVYLVNNPGADPAIKSFRWNAFAAAYNSFEEIAKRFLQAKQEQQHGNLIALADFTKLWLAQSWNSYLPTDVHKATVGEYDPGAKWDEEAYRFMTVDVQTDCFWFVVRSWARNGDSRLIAYGKVHTWQEVRDTQLKHGVKDQFVGVDVMHDTFKVYAECSKHGHWGAVKGKQIWFSWRGFQGSDEKDFTHLNQKTLKHEKHLYSEGRWGNPGQGQYVAIQLAPVYRWSNWAVKEILQRHLEGKAAKFLVPKDDEEYNSQLNAEVKKPTLDKRTRRMKWKWVKVSSTRADHLRDCECMQIVFSSMYRCLGDAPDAPDPEPAEPAAEPLGTQDTL
jgi:hypothetical protein